jgi:hypothetical protein
LCISATFLALRSIVLIELYGKDRLISSMGLLTFFQGFAILLGYELSGKFPLFFSIAGFCTRLLP